MLGRTHALIGISALATVHAATGGQLIQPHSIQGVPVGIALGFGLVTLGTLAPDIDANQSAIKSSLGLAGKAAGLALKLSGVKHRGLTHYGVTALVVTLVSLLVGRLLGYPDAGVAFGLGYCSHILADGLTRSGVPLLWPARKNVHLLPRGFRIKTGSATENLIFLLIALFLTVLIVPPELAGKLASRLHGQVLLLLN